MKRATKKQNAQRGYTLLEALISVGLLAAFAGAIGPAVFGSMRLSAAILDQGREQESARVLDESLTQIFSNAVLVSGDDEKLRLRGDQRTLRIVSLAGDSSTARIFSLRIDAGALVGGIAPTLDGEAPSQSTKLFPAGDARFSYYGRASANGPLAWRDEWDGAEPPMLVRLELATSEGEVSVPCS